MAGGVQYLSTLNILLIHVSIPCCNLLGFVIRKTPFKCLLNDPTPYKINQHGACQHHLELSRKLDQFQLLIEFRNHLDAACEGNKRHGNDSPIHGPVLAEGFAEGPALVVYCKGRDLLD